MKLTIRLIAASCVALLAAFWVPSVVANPDFSGCDGCHADIANKGPDHDTHAAALGGDCDACHGSGDKKNPPLDNCVGCHGRDADAGGDSVSAGLARGLRQHHQVSGITQCSACHSDATGPVGVGEHILPSLYLSGLLSVKFDSCDGSEEQFRSNTISLDNDGDGLTDAADSDCATNTAPVANAGPNQTVNVGDMVTLNGSGSTDADTDPLTFSWTLNTPTGSAATLSAGTTVSPTFVPDVNGIYTVTLVVDDGTEDSAPDSVLITAETVVVNTPPVANAGVDRMVDMGATVVLDGASSSDIDGDPLTYSWTLATPGGGATLSDPTAVGPSFTPDVAGVYTATLTVNDGTDDSTPDSVAITAQVIVVNTAPVADAGLDQTVNVGDTVPLNGTGSSDAEGDSITFSWSLTAMPAGSTATLTDPAAASPSFVADVEGDYVAQLIVNDGEFDSPADTALITAQVVVVNTAPTASAGINQNVSVSDTVVLDGSGSTDADGDALTFSWSLTSTPTGSVATLSDAAVMSPTFVADVAGTYVAQLIVNDGALNSAPDSMTVTAQVVVVNTPPVASAGLDQSLLIGDTATLDGSDSSDADGDPLAFSWSLSVPAGSTATLSDTGAVGPTFVTDVAGDYVAQLIVNDGLDNSTPDSVLVGVASVMANQPPVANAGAEQAVQVNATVTLNGGGSSDPESDALSFSWSLTSSPTGSAATLSDPMAVSPTFVADIAGAYVAQLIVNDGEFDSAPNTAVITATVPPVVTSSGGGGSPSPIFLLLLGGLLLVTRRRRDDEHRAHEKVLF